MVSKLIGDDGLINILNVIPVQEVLVKGIPYIRAHFDEIGYKRNFVDFWLYFTNTWLGYYDAETLKINHIIIMKKEEKESVLRSPS